MADPLVLVLDEPTSGMDPTAARGFRRRVSPTDSLVASRGLHWLFDRILTSLVTLGVVPVALSGLSIRLPEARAFLPRHPAGRQNCRGAYPSRRSQCSV